MKNIIKLFNKMFFWFGIYLFDSKLKQYGGFNHFIAKHIFRYKFYYLMISLTREWKFTWMHNNTAMYYDGFHNILWIGFLQISYGT